MDSAINTLKLARKSDVDEFMLYLKLIFLGIIIVGTIGFIIQFIGAILKIG
ncbi:MAG: protein translocase SEC61 complex subunit gamma [Thaumarchaeota archaeon]|nr:protein translocase SEC61 complex subunit gamma [Nitrososphaerota archaeon]